MENLQFDYQYQLLDRVDIFIHKVKWMKESMKKIPTNADNIP